MRRIEQLFTYSLSTIIFLLGLAFILASLLIQNSLTSSILNGFGIALCPTGMIGFLFQYLHEKVFVQKIETLISSAFLVPQETGIKRIFRNRAEFAQLRSKIYSEVKYRLYYLAVCPAYQDIIALNLLKREIDLRFLVCNPNIPFMTQWFEIDSSAYPIYAKEDIEKCLRSLYTIKKQNKDRGKIDIRIYSKSPGYYMQIIDNSLFVEPYLYGAGGGDALIIEFDKKGKQFEYFFQHFFKLWNTGITIEDFLEQSY